MSNFLNFFLDTQSGSVSSSFTPPPVEVKKEDGDSSEEDFALGNAVVDSPDNERNEEKTEMIELNKPKSNTNGTVSPPSIRSPRQKSPRPIEMETTRIVTPVTALPLIQYTPPMHMDSIEPPSKIQKITMEDSVHQRQQTQRHLELLSRLYPEQKRGVLELILKGCNNDIVQAIECILPSHERAIQQLSTLPSKSYSLTEASDTATRSYSHATSEKPPVGSAFIPFTTQPQPIPSHSYHVNMSNGGCPPGCTCQQQKCECTDCVNGKVIHGVKHNIPHSPKPHVRPHMGHMIQQSASIKHGQPPPHRMVPYVPVSSHIPSPLTEPVKICAGCGGKMKLEDQRCPICEPEQKA